MFAILEKKGIYRVQFFEKAVGLLFINYDLTPSLKNFATIVNNPEEVTQNLTDTYQQLYKRIGEILDLKAVYKLQIPNIHTMKDDKPVCYIENYRQYGVEIITGTFSTNDKELMAAAGKFPDITEKLKKTALAIAVKRNVPMPNIPPTLERQEYQVGLTALLIKLLLDVIMDEYQRQSLDILRPQPLQRALQPLNIDKTKERNIASLPLECSYKELLTHRPDLYKELELFLKESHELLLPKLSSVYEQMVIDVVARLINHSPVKANNIHLIRLYIKPDNFPMDYHDNILIISKKDLMKIFKLSASEFKHMFIGYKNRPSAIMRLNGKPFTIRNKHGEVRLSNILEVTTFETEQLSYMEIEPHWIFYQTGKQFVKDNFWKLRKIKEKVNPKAHRALLNLRNKLITLNKPLEFSFNTLAGYAGLSTRKRREKSRMKEQILEYLSFLQGELGDIRYKVINNEKVKIWREV